MKHTLNYQSSKPQKLSRAYVVSVVCLCITATCFFLLYFMDVLSDVTDQRLRFRLHLLPDAAVLAAVIGLVTAFLARDKARWRILIAVGCTIFAALTVAYSIIG